MPTDNGLMLELLYVSGAAVHPLVYFALQRKFPTAAGNNGN